MDGAFASQLQHDFASTREAVQNHSGDWDPTRSGRPCPKTSGHHHGRLVRTADSAPRARSCDPVRNATDGGAVVASGDGDSTISREGSVAVKRMVDTTKSLVHSLEEALVARVGLMASMFHTWRCEASMWQVGRQYQEE